MLIKIIRNYAELGRQYTDLSVLADNNPAIKLYEKLGFLRIPNLSVKHKSPINNQLFSARLPEGYEQLNPYARVVGDEARKRGIKVQVLNPEWGELQLTYAGRKVISRESLSELVTAIAVSRCDDKRVTRHVVAQAGIRVPLGHQAKFDKSDQAFLSQVKQAVVKPARGEQGAGITVDIKTNAELEQALKLAHQYCADVLIEEYCPGQDLRLLVIDYKLVAAATRKPACVMGDGSSTVRQLIKKQSRKRAAATGGESKIPMDSSTEQAVRDAGFTFDSVLPDGLEIFVRKNSNLHTGGTINDVTDIVHPDLADVAVKAAKAIGIPVTGIDLIVKDLAQSEYVFIEANERPGLASLAPAPAAYLDYLFPETKTEIKKAGNF